MAGGVLSRLKGGADEFDLLQFCKYFLLFFPYFLLVDRPLQQHAPVVHYPLELFLHVLQLLPQFVLLYKRGDWFLSAGRRCFGQRG